ncbi:hypothetical protein E2F43_15600 [Seongchinamella unica]|uniref:Uncharacterized protein n=1 Tax=Seongchinamella unica TaxID=2547392 RepID=A0A4R5LQY8_9GAMM|nr:hypothetical protein [Seongchinamella unica]TDG12971.1 hypothetical protein E2F43_15600 [Seongchinamella unica]
MAIIALLAGAQTLAEASRYERIVQALESADPELRASFASSALLELTEVYLAEADLARRQARDSDEALRLTAWSRAVERYAAQLALVLDDITLGFPVQLRRHPREAVSVSVAGRTIMLAHPRSGQQPTYEQSVLGQFCGQGLCRDLVAVEEATAAIPMSPGLVSPHWEFTALGPRCSHYNLQLAFRGDGDLGQQRALCQQLLEEAELLATELAWQQRHGVSVDWEVLTIRAVPLRPEHLVLLNTAGDSLLVTLPLLHGTEGLLGQLVPWLRQRFNSERPLPPVLLEAAVLGWE